MNTLFKDFCARYAGKKVAFLGAGISHTGIIPDFVAAGAEVYVCDHAQQLSPEAESILSKYDIQYRFGAGYLGGLTEFDLIFRSPGISYLTPEIVEAVEAGCKVTGEIELFFDLCPCASIGITGSDGKTTTSTLIYEMLTAAGRTAHLGGNIGQPLLPRLKDMSDTDIVVAELSSFQLMSFKTSPTIAVVTNIHQNHLDYHRDMREYIDSKRQILLHGADTAVLNADDPEVTEMLTDAPQDLRLFSSLTALPDGAYVNDDCIWLSRGGKAEKVLPVSDLKLPGLHNAMNAAAACAAVRELCSEEAMRQVLGSFTGVKHRIQFVRELSGVRYYNDSIATTPSRTAVCLKSFPAGSILIAGGSDKGVDYSELAADVIEKVKLLILTGATSDKIEAAVRGCPSYSGFPNIIRAADLAEAVKLAHENAVSGDNVLLSPASASFDCFKNYAARGDLFAHLVGELDEIPNFD